MIDASILRQIPRESRVTGAQEMILDMLVVSLNEEPSESITRLVRSITDFKVLNPVLFHAARVDSMDEFEAKLNEMVLKR